jgi:hypothetical protein
MAVLYVVLLRISIGVYLSRLDICTDLIIIWDCCQGSPFDEDVRSIM